MPALVVIGFDFTIAKANTHNMIARCRTAKGDPEKEWNIVKDIPVYGDPRLWHHSITRLINANHLVCIASFNHFKHIPPRFLLEKLNIDEELLRKIHFETWVPDNPSSANKNLHIANAIKASGFKGLPKDIILIDDNIEIILAAEKIGYTTIFSDGTQAQKLHEKVNALCVSEEKAKPRQVFFKPAPFMQTIPEETEEDIRQLHRTNYIG